MGLKFELDPTVADSFPNIEPLTHFDPADPDMVMPQCKLIREALGKNIALVKAANSSSDCENGLMKTYELNAGGTVVVYKFDSRPKYSSCAVCIVSERRELLVKADLFIASDQVGK